MSRLAIIAGQGRLPELLAAEAGEFVAAEMEGFPSVLPSAQTFRLERLRPFMASLHEQDVSRVVFAGALQRPRLDPTMFDPETLKLVPRVMMAMQGGDDAALREVLAIFEEDGFAVLGADQVAPGLVPGAGALTQAQPSKADLADIERAAKIVAAIGSVDVGQGAVVAQGLCLAAESLPGTDAMLDWVADTARRPDPNGAKGVLYKAPKPGQERRVDLPAIGPATVARAAAAGLAGIAFEAGGLLLIDRQVAVAAADAAGLFLWGRGPA